MSGKDLTSEYTLTDKAFEIHLRSDFSSSSELFSPLSLCEVFNDFNLQFVIESVSSKSACVTHLMNVCHKVIFTVM